MINTSDRGEAIKLIDEAIAAGARQAQACSELGLKERTLQRWRIRPFDGRPAACRNWQLEDAVYLNPERDRANEFRKVA